MSEENQYLNLLKEVYENGKLKPNRTDNQTKSIFGSMMKFTLSKNNELILPLLTTKDMMKSSNSIFKELEFFIKAQTDSKILDKQGVKIWNANGSKANMKKLNIDREEGDLGPVYGWNWRHFGAEYTDCNADYENKGIDQLSWVINEIKSNPFSRRLIVTAWDPSKLNQVVLPACHCYFQFNVEPDKELNPKYLDCMVYQRSADLPLGVPFNIASYSVLTHIVAKLTSLKAGTLTYITGDTHIYENQMSLIPVQLERKPYEFPNIIFNTDFKNIDEFKSEYITVKNYERYKYINYPFSL